MRHLLLYSEVNDFENEQNSEDYVTSIIPGVGYVLEDEGVRYNRKKGPVLKCVYVTERDNQSIYFSSVSNIYAVTVNGEPVSQYDTYTAVTPGEYVVEIELEEGTTELCGSLYGISDVYVPEGITSICGGFTGNGTGSGILGKLYLPSTLQSMGSVYDPSFGPVGGGEITCLAPVAPTLVSQYEFYDVPSSGTLYHPAGADYSTWLAKLPNGWDEEDI